MTNLPITGNNSQCSTNIASTARKDDATNAQSADPFGAVLARQMDEANASASNMPSTATGVDTKTMADSAASTGKAEHDKVPTSDITPIDPSNALAVMLQLPQEIKTSVAKDAASSTTQANTMVDLTATASGKSDAAVMVADSAAVGTFKPGAGKAAATQLVDNISASQANTRVDLTATASGKSDVAVMVADSAAVGAFKPGAGKATATQLVDNINASQANTRVDLTATASGKSDAAVMVADKLALHGGSGLEVTKSAELPNILLSAAPSAQGITLSTASMATSGISSGMSTHNKTADSLQIISSPLGSSGWSDEFSQKIIWMSMQRNQVAELHLNPPNLGPLDVVLKISDNQATALFTSPHGAVRDAVENAMPRLREMLADNGIMLGNTTVSDQSPRDRSAEGFMNQGSGTAAQRGVFSDTSESTRSSPTTTQAMPVRRHNGMVDTYA